MTSGYKQSGNASLPSSWRLAGRSLDLSQRPCIMGILNVTPDSFSDGSRYLDLDRAAARAFRLVEEGADIIDIGGESTRPNVAPVDAEEELRRVVPLVERLSGRIPVPISVDTYKAVVAREALRAGAEIVNDISGLTFDPAMATTVAEAAAGLVVMHTRGRPDSMQKDTTYGDLIAEVLDSLRNSVSTAVAAGVAKDRIVVDPGIGFGKSVPGNLEILRRLGEFESLHLPILVGTSRKSFIGTVLGRDVDDRLFGTAATVALALANGASIIRVHDVREMRDVADMTHAVLHPDAS
ncbi:dihydropteroate synthase [Geobacter sp.]|uniref:dihydropteroate synthase n=1 Tax=Geobacter sp. TaxID=46610 RepID=UPI0027BA634A|nr:dihydropteroate synthase [Geobacter sp.]